MKTVSSLIRRAVGRGRKKMGGKAYTLKSVKGPSKRAYGTT